MKKDYVGQVVKFFKIRSCSDKEDSICIKDIIDIWYDIIQQESDDAICCVSLNYGSKEWKSLSGFYKFIKDKPNEYISELFIFCNHEENCLFYSNSLNNEKIKRKNGIEELYLSFCNSSIANEELFKSMVVKMYSIFNFDYAYFFDLEENIELISENKKKKSWFSVSVSVNKKNITRDEKMLEIKNGFIPRIYKYNIFNKEQIVRLNSTFRNPSTVPINEQLTLYVK